MPDFYLDPTTQTFTLDLTGKDPRQLSDTMSQAYLYIFHLDQHIRLITSRKDLLLQPKIPLGANNTAGVPAFGVLEAGMLEAWQTLISKMEGFKTDLWAAILNQTEIAQEGVRTINTFRPVLQAESRSWKYLDIFDGMEEEILKELEAGE
ncbi:MAG: hypothetical protein Q9222_006767 [Ikaeria aurantiellina]